MLLFPFPLIPTSSITKSDLRLCILICLSTVEGLDFESSSRRVRKLLVTLFMSYFEVFLSFLVSSQFSPKKAKNFKRTKSVYKQQNVKKIDKS